MSLYEAASSGSRLAALEALRDQLARELDSCDSKRDFASLSQRFMDAVKQIDELSTGEEAPGTGLSEFERRMREREAASPAKSRTRKAN